MTEWLAMVAVLLGGALADRERRGRHHDDDPQVVIEFDDAAGHQGAEQDAVVAVDARAHGIEFRDESQRQRDSRQQCRRKGQAQAGVPPEKTAIIVNEAASQAGSARRATSQTSKKLGSTGLWARISSRVNPWISCGNTSQLSVSRTK